jgi:hypothetical protein
MDARFIENTNLQWKKTYSTIALAKSAMERIPLHSWEMEFSIQYHLTINNSLNIGPNSQLHGSIVFYHKGDKAWF